MKITSVDTICLSRMHELERQWITNDHRVIKADAAIVRITTDAGVVGIGEATPYGAPLMIKSAVEELSSDLIGKQLSQAELPHQRPRTDVIKAFPYVLPREAAIAGLDTALWDLRAQIADLPLAQLLNPKAESSVPLYASQGCSYDWRDRPERLIEDVQRDVRAGFKACKVRLGTKWEWDGINVDRFLGLIRDLRAETPNDVALMVDGNGRLDLDTATIVAIELERLQFKWFEEPMPLAPETYAQLSNRVAIPITGCEGYASIEQFRPFIEHRAVSVVQPDVAVTGITEALKIANLARDAGIAVCPHNWHNDLMTIANAHYVAAIGTTYPLERCTLQGPLQAALLSNQLNIIDGTLHLENASGLGVRLADELEAAFPFVEGHYAIEVTRCIETA